jgi:iron-sulfur cluster insertion protein
MNQENIFTLSESAIRRISFLINKKNDPSIKLRILVEGGGCSGFQYRYEFVNDDITAEDLYIEENGAKVIIDYVSLELIKGSCLDFLEDLAGSHFQIKNPIAKSGCGCGNSFSI